MKYESQMQHMVLVIVAGFVKNLSYSFNNLLLKLTIPAYKTITDLFHLFS